MAAESDESENQMPPAFLDQIESKINLGLYEREDYAGHDGARRPRSIEWFGRNHVSSLSLVSLRHMFRLGKEKLLPGEQKRRPWSLGNAFFEGYRWIRVMKRHIVYPGGINGPGCPLKKLLILRGPQGLFSN